MMDRKYLMHGLDALGRAHGLDYFRDGHRGAAIVSAYFLCSALRAGTSRLQCPHPTDQKTRRTTLPRREASPLG